MASDGQKAQFYKKGEIDFRRLRDIKVAFEPEKIDLHMMSTFCSLAAAQAGSSGAPAEPA
jgi:hypothetical protein